ncbi:hypothetical protein [Nocardioides sp. TF02-7]|uniref:hypothetical protein n=1 Tax=Nocardioides sp. TF02-7 TaxID=2917724 RepID=UPI001F06CF82|nr:hypothetical protein [Nocardioides sp. TF02-7]UMG91547.1 hypothetical protein MF408_15720 [Nocardioides sp. TF02-7]
MPAARSRAPGGAPATPVIVVADQGMVADTVARALTELGLAARPGRWPGSPDDEQGGAAPADVGVVVVEAPDPGRAAAVEALLADGSARRWIVLAADTGSPEWAPVLAAATLVLPRGTALADVVAAIRLVAGQESP